MKTRSIILFVGASIILLSFTFISNSYEENKVNTVNAQPTSVKDSHGGLVMEDPNQWD